MLPKEHLTTLDTYNNLTQEEYDKIFNQELASDLLGMFIDSLKGKELLDVGCGPGRDCKYFMGLGYGITGIDNSKKMVEEAKRRVIGGKFFKMDMSDLAFHTKKFDGIWCFGAFLHVPKKEALGTLKGFNRILKHRGSLSLSVKLGKGEEYENKKYGRKRFFSYYNEGEIQDLLINAGFEIIDIKHSKHNNNDWLTILAKKQEHMS